MSFTGKSEIFLNSIIVNDGFFPDLKLGDLQTFYRVPAEYKQEVVEHHLRVAVDQCNNELDCKKTEWILKGATKLEDVTQAEIGGVNKFVLQYQRAVFCRAMALLVRAFAVLSRRAEAENLAKEGEATEDDYYAQANRALRVLQGIKTNINAELL